MATKTERHGPFLGINNRLPDFALGVSERGRKAGDWLRNAVNVDLTDAGTLKLRPGPARRIECSDAHSLWDDGRQAYYVDGDTLYRYPREAVLSGLTPRLRASYDADPRGGVFWSNGVTIGRIEGAQALPLGVPTPNPAPGIAADGGGSLPGGKYIVAVVAVSALGEHSPPTDPVQIDVPENGVIEIAGLTGQCAVFMSPQNGDELYLAAQTDQPATAIYALPEFGPTIQTLELQPMPPGQIVRWADGRLLVASGSTLIYSDRYMPALFNPLRDYIPFAQRITVMEPCGGGVFIVADKTYFLSGVGRLDAQLPELLPYGAIEGTASRSPWDESVTWFSERGLVVGSPDGTVKNVQEDVIAVGAAEYGASFFVERDGMRQIVAALFQAGPMQAAAHSFLEDESERKEQML